VAPSPCNGRNDLAGDIAADCDKAVALGGIAKAELALGVAPAAQTTVP